MREQDLAPLPWQQHPVHRLLLLLGEAGLQSTKLPSYVAFTTFHSLYPSSANLVSGRVALDRFRAVLLYSS